MNTHAVRTRPAFTLLETLLAVLVLGLGLLGLMAVFPTIAAQQRDASETIRAGSVAATIDGQVGPTDGILRGLIEQSGVTFDDSLNVSFGFGAGGGFGYYDDPANERPFSFLWEVDWAWNYIDENGNTQAAGGSSALEEYRGDGGLRFSTRDRNDLRTTQADASDSTQGPDIPVTARLIPPPIPAAGGGAPQPRFVWDLVPRRDANGEIQVAIFVRRVSPGIRVPGGRTLAEVLTGVARDGTRLDRDEWRLPLGYDFDEHRVLPGGAPADSNDGTIGYAVPMGAAARVLDVGERFRDGGNPEDNVTQDTLGRYIEVGVVGARTLVGPSSTNDTRAPDGPDDLDFLARPGQLFVDNLGVVRRVEEVFRDAGNNGALIGLEISPPYNAGAISTAGLGNNPNSNNGPRPFISELRQVVFTPQVPVSITVRTLSR